MVKNKNFKVAIVGLGYVGLPLSIEFGKKYQTLGYDINNKRIKELKLGFDFNNEHSKKEIINSKYI